MPVIRIPRPPPLANDDTEIIGKNVKDMYGTSMGRVAGTMTDIDGTVQSVGVDCGPQGLRLIQRDQLVVQGEVVIFIPKWRLDSQRLIREKQLTLRRLRALIDIVSDNDDMRSDAEAVHERYRSKLASLDEAECEIKAVLEARLAELDGQLKSAKTLSFDAKVQSKSNEISDATFEAVRSCTADVIEHITGEMAEIANVKARIADLDADVQEMAAAQAPNIQESAVSYLETAEQVQTILPEVPAETAAAPEPVAAGVAPVPGAAFPEPPAAADAPRDGTDGDWLARMEAQ